MAGKVKMPHNEQFRAALLQGWKEEAPTTLPHDFQYFAFEEVFEQDRMGRQRFFNVFVYAKKKMRIGQWEKIFPKVCIQRIMGDFLDSMEYCAAKNGKLKEIGVPPKQRTRLSKNYLQSQGNIRTRQLGLVNWNNNCFINSVIQLLNFLFSEHDLALTVATQEIVALQKVLKCLRNHNSSGDLKKNLILFNTFSRRMLQCADGTQQDPMELLSRPDEVRPSLPIARRNCLGLPSAVSCSIKKI